MIEYSIIWSLEADYLVGQIWLNSRDFGEISSAITRLEMCLSREPRPPEAIEREGLWFLSMHPLRIAYEIDDDAMSVFIVNVGRSEP
jgi:hypothetical protein